jgi:hypothetical protein
MSEDELVAHLSAHAETCEDPPEQFAWDPFGCSDLRHDYFERALKTPAASRLYWIDGKLFERIPVEADDSDQAITLAYIERPNTSIWAEIRTGGALEKEASAAVKSFEESQPAATFTGSTTTQHPG